MPHISLKIPERVYEAVRSHLLPRRFVAEEVAFVYVQENVGSSGRVFGCIEWFPVPPSGFLSRSAFHLELTDRTRASVIKRAHDLESSLVEFHSHAGSKPARFSPSDLAGFEEFVPHVWWRLKGRPYFAVVVSRASFDGLAWITDPRTPQHLDEIKIENDCLLPTKLSPLQPHCHV